LRYAYWLVTQPKEVVERFGRTIQTLAQSVRHCDVCGQWSDRSPCTICADPKRDASSICVVATSPDIKAVEETGVFKGTYHVLGGPIDPIEGRTPDTLRIPQLIERAKMPIVKEIILALDTDIQGDVTVLYLKKQLSNLPLKVMRLARGMPTGAALEYADAHTLADALQNRKET
jgi:recombination protein RecR